MMRSAVVNFGSRLRRLLRGALVDLREDGITTSGGVVTAWKNSGYGGSKNNFVYLDGTGDYVSTPDTAGNSIVSDITLIGCLSANDWTPAAASDVMSKWVTTGDQRSFVLQIGTDGKLTLFISTDGAAGTIVSAASTATTGFTDGTAHWVRATWDNSANTVNYYTSGDAPSTAYDEVSWTQLGDADVSLSASGIFDSTAPIEVGSQDGGLAPFAGKIYRAVAIASTDPTAAAAVDMDPAQSSTPNESTFTSGSVVWTLQADAKVRDNEYSVDTVVGTGANIKDHPTGSALFFGASGDYLSTPDTAGNSIASDITLIAYVQPDDWTPSALMDLVNKYNATGNQRGWILRLQASGAIAFLTSSDGTNLVSSASTVATGFTDGTGHWIRVTWDNAANTTNFYTSDEAPTTDPLAVSWTQLGDADVAHSDTAIFDSTASIEIGSVNAGGANNFLGKIHRVAVIADTDPTATAAVDMDPTNWTTGTTFSSGGVTWTLNGNSFIQNSGYTVVHAIGSAGLETTTGIDIANPMTIFAVMRYAQASPSATQVSLGARSDTNKNAGFYSDDTDSDKFGATGGSANNLTEAYSSDWHVHSLQHNGGATSRYRVSGVGETTADFGSENLDWSTLFANLSGAQTSQMAIASIKLVPRTMSNAETDYVANHLVAKYGTS